MLPKEGIRVLSAPIVLSGPGKPHSKSLATGGGAQFQLSPEPVLLTTRALHGLGVPHEGDRAEPGTEGPSHCPSQGTVSVLGIGHCPGDVGPVWQGPWPGRAGT